MTDISQVPPFALLPQFPQLRREGREPADRPIWQTAAMKRFIITSSR